MIGTILIIVLFIIIGVIFSMGKGSFLIAGFNTLPEEEKAKYDTVALCKFMGKMMFSLTFSMGLWVISEVYEWRWLFFVGLLLFVGTIIFLLIYINTGGRFKRE